MDPLQQALALLDEAAAIIAALLDLSKTKEQKPEKENMQKQAEIFAAKNGFSYDRAYDMLKKAEDLGVDANDFEKVAELFVKDIKDTPSFGKVSETDGSSRDMLKTAKDRAEAAFSELEL